MFKRKRAAEISALESFLEQDNNSIELGDISRGLVEIVYCGNHSSNGLLITSDGYFLTPKHCQRLSYIRLSTGIECRISHVCIRNKYEDLALVKADIPVEPRAIKYGFNNVRDELFKIEMLTRRCGMLKKEEGRIFSNFNPFPTKLNGGRYVLYHEQFTIDIIAKPGQSGGLVIDSRENILGLLSGGNWLCSHVVRQDKFFRIIKSYLKKVTCADWDSNPGHRLGRPRF